MLVRGILRLTLALAVSVPVFADEPVVLLHVNDLHGQVLPVRRSGGNLEGGFRGLAAMVAAERSAAGAERVLLLDAGDWFQGTPEGNLTQGRYIIELLNALGVDASEIGNHDFDLGVANLRELIDLAEYPVLGANVLEPDGSGPVPWAERSVIIERGGIRFGIVGVVTEETKEIVIAHVAKDLSFASAIETVRAEVGALRSRGAECVVVLSHLGVIAERALAKEVPGIDLIVGGHSHTLVPVPWVEPTTGTVVVQAESNAQQLGRLEISRGDGGFTIRGACLPIPGRTDPVGAGFEAVVERYRPQIEGRLERVLGTSPANLPNPLRYSEEDSATWHPRANPLGTWIAAEMAHVAGTKIGIQNRGGIRADLPQGPVTERDLFQISPFGNTVVVCTMTGEKLREVAERSLAEPTKRLDVHGLTIGWTHGGEFDGKKRLISLEVDGDPVEPEKLYEVATNNFVAPTTPATVGGDGWTQFLDGKIRDTGVEVLEATIRGIERLAETPELQKDAIERSMEEHSYVQEGTSDQRLVSLFGLVVLFLLAWLLSTDRKTIPWRAVLWGIGLQAILAALILRTEPGRIVFRGAKAAFDLVLRFSMEGAQFVFGPLANVGISEGVFGHGNGWIFAFQVAATIILVSSVTAILYHIGIMQVIVYALAKGMQVTLRTSGAESLAAAANIFVGQTEAPLVVRPYLARFTPSETMALMTGGMATVAGGVLAAYVGLGIDGGHLLAASVMSAPAALAIAKLMVPEKEHSATAADVPFEIQRIDHNVLDAACRGASDGLKLALNVMAMLIAFTALVALINWGIGSIHTWFLPQDVLENAEKLAEQKWSLQKLLGWLFAPIAWLLGVPKAEMFDVGALLGIKMTLNEFFAYIELSKIQESLSPRSVMLTTYALCGFANFASIAIQIGGISALEKGIRPSLARLGLRAMLGGTLAALSTAAIAGVIS